MGRQLFQDGPYIDPPIGSITALTLNTIEPLWVAATWTPIFANDAKAGKIYCVRAGGIVTIGTAGSTGIITPFWNAIALGAGPAQQLPLMSNIIWTLQFDLVFRSIGAAGNLSTCIGAGVFQTQGTLATPGTGSNLVFGGTVASVDATINASIQINKTWSAGVNSIQTHYVYIFSRN